jgi:hypothetical protein
MISSPLRWKKSSYSTGTGQECVEVAPINGFNVAFRDSRSSEGLQLRFPYTEWILLIGELKSEKRLS